MNQSVYYEPYKLQSGLLAVAVHAAFFALLYFGFSWQTQPAAVMSVELWQSLPRAAAAATPVKPREIAPPQPAPTPDIALPDKDQAEAQQAEIKPAIPATGSAKSAATGQAGVGDPAATASATAAAARDAAIGRVVDEYIGKIAGKIHRNIVMPPEVSDDARAEFSVTLLPGGTVLAARLTRTSGNAAYDNAVERAILKSQPLPLPADVTMFNKFRVLKLVFKPVE